MHGDESLRTPRNLSQYHLCLVTVGSSTAWTSVTQAGWSSSDLPAGKESQGLVSTEPQDRGGELENQVGRNSLPPSKVHPSIQIHHRLLFTLSYTEKRRNCAPTYSEGLAG